MSDTSKFSYTAASCYPLKISFNPELMDSIINYRKILPWHLQLNLTNKCSFNCSFCSCSNRMRDVEMDFDRLTQFIEDGNITPSWRYPSVTITGGGEPTFYSKINEAIGMLKRSRMDIGLVTNGSNIQVLDKASLRKLTWTRISSSDELDKQTNLAKWFDRLQSVVESAPEVDWAFSHVLSEHPNFGILKQIVTFANKHDFTHIRIVSDLLNLDKVSSMDIIRRMLEAYGLDTSRIIFQGRKEYTHGQKKCYISLLKPVISADEKILPCCGTQYAKDPPSRDYDSSMIMGGMLDLPQLIKSQKCFDGSQCIRCYYQEYNTYLEMLLSELKHVRFI